MKASARLLLLMLTMVSASSPAAARTPRVPAAQDEFVPISELPPEDRLPAAPLLIAAYAVFWLLPFLYLWFMRRKMAAVDGELAELRRRLDRVRPSEAGSSTARPAS